MNGTIFLREVPSSFSWPWRSWSGLRPGPEPAGLPGRGKDHSAIFLGGLGLKRERELWGGDMTSKSFLKGMRKLGLMGTLVFVGLLAPNIAQAQLVVDGGNTLSVPPDIINSVTVGDTGQGTLNQTGGTVKGSIILGNQATGNGTYNLSGGTIRDVNDSPYITQ